MNDQAKKESDPVALAAVLEVEYSALGREVPPASAQFAADSPSRLAEVYRMISKQAPLSALCISGGGIRSATFALGAIQGFARRGILPHFDYLSTVSGGGYIGSWLSAWIKRADGIEAVLPNLATEKPEIKNRRNPIHHLREYNSYLTPKAGFGSLDTWTLGAIVIRNLLLNWCLLVPLLMLALMLPRLFVSVLQIAPPGAMDPYPWFGTVENVLKYWAAILFSIATISIFRSLPSVGNANPTEKQFRRQCFAPVVLSVFVFLVLCWWFWDDQSRVPELSRLAAVIALVAVGAWVLYVLLFRFRDGAVKMVRQLFGPVALGVLLFGLSTGTAASILTSAALFTPSSDKADASFYAALAPVLFLGSTLIGGVVFVGVTSRTLGEDDREWLSRAGAHLLSFLAGWLILCTIVLLAPHYFFQLGVWAKSAIAAAGGIGGVITAWLGGSASTKARNSSEPGANAPHAPKELLIKVALVTFVIVLLVGLSIATNAIISALRGDISWIEHREIIQGTSLNVTVPITLALLAITYIAGRFININRFSLHGMYRNRLVRAYLGASNDATTGFSEFTGFNSTDNLLMHELRGQRPLHVVNTALNLVSGARLDWQQRKAESFVFTPYHSGSLHTGFRDSSEYGGPDGVSLGTAITISGAAASPNMGYHSSPLVGFVMMLLNARLGGWLGNPGKAGRNTWWHEGPKSAVSPVVRETLGLTTDQGSYVYLSDGGHFENLALYEMVLRRCRNIVVLDAGCDPKLTYEDLGNAIRKIRIDLGVPIEFAPEMIEGLRTRQRRCAIGTIRYKCADPGEEDGTLVYIKPMMLGDESPDVQTYQCSSPTFPHESTDNQWFNEAQTESYRMLASHTVDSISAGWTGSTFEEFVTHIRSVYLGKPTGVSVATSR